MGATCKRYRVCGDGFHFSIRLYPEQANYQNFKLKILHAKSFLNISNLLNSFKNCFSGCGDRDGVGV